MQYQKANVTGTIRGPNVTRALNEKLLALWATPQDNGAMVPTSTMKYQVSQLSRAGEWVGKPATLAPREVSTLAAQL